MFGLKKMFSKKAAEIKNTGAKMTNKDLVEAVVSGSLLVAFADGNCDDSEISALENILASDEQFDAWRSEIPGLISKYAAKFAAGYKLGKLSALREISDLNSDKKDAELALVCIITVAEHGGIDEKEKAVLGEIAIAFGLRLDTYL